MHTLVPRHTRARAAAALLALAPAALAAQTPTLLTADPVVQRAMAAMPTLQAWTLEQQVEIGRAHV